MRKLLLTAVAVLAFDGSAHAGHDADSYTDWIKRLTPNAQALKEPAHAGRGDPIGWVKSADIGCGGFSEGTGWENNKDACAAKDNYTDDHKKGNLCATFGIPVYDRPNGKTIGLLYS